LRRSAAWSFWRWTADTSPEAVFASRFRIEFEAAADFFPALPFALVGVSRTVVVPSDLPDLLGDFRFILHPPGGRG
jgi:hypothetical protein